MDKQDTKTHDHVRPCRCVVEVLDGITCTKDAKKFSYLYRQIIALNDEIWDKRND